MNHDQRYFDMKTYYHRRFGGRVQKLSVDAGLGCPNRDGTIGRGGCIFCNPRGSGTGAHAKGMSIEKQIESGKAYLTKRYGAKKFIVYFQSFTNTYAPVDVLAGLYDDALRDPAIVGIAIGTRPDCVDEAVLDLLASYARHRMVWIEYGLQSMHDETLNRIHRGHNFQSFANAVNNTRGRGILICAHMILGLPGENRDHMLQTARMLASMGIDGVKLHLLYVVRGTPLEKQYQQGRYSCLTQTEYVSLVCDVLAQLPPDMVIHRLTGDPHKRELVAPAWSLKKNQTIDMIKEAMRRQNLRQGSQFNQNA